MKWRICIFLFTTILLPLKINAQHVAVKTNLLYDAALTLNGGVEFNLSNRWTTDISGNYNNWALSHGRRWKHWFVQPEARYWFCEKFSGHFLGIHAHGGKYNVGNVDCDFKLLGTDFGKLKDNRFQGWFVGAGVGYGYSWILSKHWNLEAEIGVGYAYSRYDRFPCATCGEKIESDKAHHYFGPTKLALNLVYVF